MAGAIETELTEATEFKPPKGGFKARQDLLAALAKSAYKLDDDTFDEVTDEAAKWVNKAIKAINNKAEIPEPDGEEPEAEDEDTATDDTPADEDENAAEEAAAEAEAEAKAEAEEAAQEAKPKNKPEKAAKPAKASKKKFTPEPPLPRTPEMAKVKTRYDNVTGDKDRYGVIIGTKTHDAVLMYEKGATSKQIQEALGEGPAKAGGRFYNILRKLSEDGHLVERDADGVFKLTHKDDIGQASPTRPTKNTRLPLKKSRKAKQ